MQPLLQDPNALCDALECLRLGGHPAFATGCVHAITRVLLDPALCGLLRPRTQLAVGTACLRPTMHAPPHLSWPVVLSGALAREGARLHTHPAVEDGFEAVLRACVTVLSAEAGEGHTDNDVGDVITEFVRVRPLCWREWKALVDVCSTARVPCADALMTAFPSQGACMCGCS